jgi:hypothetical protein
MIAPENAVLRERTSPIIVIFCIGLMAEFILPWAVIWLSDMFSLISWDSRYGSFWRSPALSLLVTLIHWALWTWPKQPPRAWGHELQGR